MGIDDISRTDKYGRLVCVVYLDYNSTHNKNVNKALLVAGVATIWNYYNEFNPSTWTLYVQKAVIPEFPSTVILPIFLVIISLVVLIPRLLARALDVAQAASQES